MTLTDVAKALLLALMLMVANIAMSIVVVAAYSYGVDPGHDAAYYQAKAEQIAPWSSVVFGVVLFYVAALIAAFRQPERNAVAFALAAALFYIAIDAVILQLAGNLFVLGDIVAVSYVTKAIAALAGARMGIHKRSLASP